MWEGRVDYGIRRHLTQKGGVDCGREGYILGGSHIDAYSIAYSCLKGCTFWEEGVDSRRVAYIYYVYVLQKYLKLIQNEKYVFMVPRSPLCRHTCII